MPPPPGIAGLSFFGSSATMASVVIKSPATDAAPCNAARTTLVGSMMPLDIMLTYSPGGIACGFQRVEQSHDFGRDFGIAGLSDHAGVGAAEA